MYADLLHGIVTLPPLHELAVPVCREIVPEFYDRCAHRWVLNNLRPLVSQAARYAEVAITPEKLAEVIDDWDGQAVVGPSTKAGGAIAHALDCVRGKLAIAIGAHPSAGWEWIVTALVEQFYPAIEVGSAAGWAWQAVLCFHLENLRATETLPLGYPNIPPLERLQSELEAAGGLTRDLRAKLRPHLKALELPDDIAFRRLLQMVQEVAQTPLVLSQYNRSSR